MKHIYFIRHAPTIVNQTGEMVANYKEVKIQPLDKQKIYSWFYKVGKYIHDFNHVYVSNTTRSVETAQTLMSSSEIIINDALNEIDCSGLGSEKFWEIKEKRFNELVKVDLASFDQKVQTFIDRTLNLDESESIVCITHGLYVRHLYHMLTKNKANSLYKQINSVDFAFNPLDMLEVIYELPGEGKELKFSEFKEIKVYRNSL